MLCFHGVHPAADGAITVHLRTNSAREGAGQHTFSFRPADIRDPTDLYALSLAIISTSTSDCCSTSSAPRHEHGQLAPTPART